MSDQHPPGMCQVALHVAWQEPGGGRRDDGVGLRRRIDLGEDGALEFEPLRYALLNEFGAFDRIGDARRDSQLTASRTVIAEQAFEDALGTVHDLLRLALGVRRRVVDGGVDPVQDEPGRPPAADHPAADASGALGAVRHLVPSIPPELLPAAVRSR